MKLPPNELMVKRYRAGLGRVVARSILLLTTTGRKSGRLHTVPVQYENINGKLYVGAAGGLKSDWYRNILADPQVGVEIGRKCRTGAAEPLVGEEKIADFMQYRLKRHPLMIGLILRSDGCSFRPARAELLKYSRKITVAIITLDP